MQIFLSNHNPNSQHKKATIDLATRTCTLDEQHSISLQQLLHHSDFHHPLLTVVTNDKAANVFHYEYDDIDGLLHASAFVYSTLIHSNTPQNCQFKINPSPRFQWLKSHGQIGFSTELHQPAHEFITIAQLETLIQAISGIPFKFCEDVVIDDSFTWQDLPGTVDGDSLYIAEERIVELLKHPVDFSAYELRYIHPDIGFGVFTNKSIGKGDIITFYTGVKKTQKSLTNRRYFFDINSDCLNMYLDAHAFGNITRFINHAPKEEESESARSRNQLLTANLTPIYHYLNGISVVIYSVNSDIAVGEQLLVNYGKPFFTNTPMARFKSNGNLVIPLKDFFKFSRRKKLAHFKIMANHGIKKARSYIILRWTIILAMITSIFGALNYFL